MSSIESKEERRSDLKTLSETPGFDEWCADVMALLAQREEQEPEQVKAKNTFVAHMTKRIIGVSIGSAAAVVALVRRTTSSAHT
jgi:short subunit dehydrogenase-like uncharacterized protein